MKLNLQKFSNKKEKNVIAISLGKSSGFGLSAGFVRSEFADKKILGVNLFYGKNDDNEILIGFKFLEIKEKGMVSVSIRNDGAYINAKNFIKEYKIDQEKMFGRYIPEKVIEDDIGQIYLIKLKDNTVK